MGWTDWHPADEQLAATLDREHGSREALYMVATDDEDGKPIPVPRVLGIDSEGVLYLGRGQLADRVADARSAAKAGSGAHEKVRKAHGMAARLSGQPRPLLFAWIVVEKADAAELRWLEGYEQKFGELPPCNSAKGGGRKA